MKKKTLTLAVIMVIALLLICGIVFVSVSYARGASSDTSSDLLVSPTPEQIKNERGDDYTYIPPTEENSNEKPIDTEADITEPPFVPATEIDLDPTSITVFVNKEYSLPKDYIPTDLISVNVYFDLSYYDDRTMMRPEAAKALERLFQAAHDAGYDLSGVSGFRSYERQQKIFTDNILTKGKVHTLKYSAVPGTSEHQTGLAMDISSASLKYNLSETFAHTPEGIWVAENAYRFGYIIRYPEGKGDITGYAYEPWHIRYVGKGLAKYLYDNDLTLEEYYHYTPSKDFNFEALYANLINITPTVTPTVIATVTPTADGLILDENGNIIDTGLGNEPTPTPKINKNHHKSDTKGNGASIVPTPTMTPEATTIPDKDQGSDGSTSDNADGTQTTEDGTDQTTPPPTTTPSSDSGSSEVSITP